MTKFFFFFFCQRQVYEFRPQLRFSNEKTPLFPYDSVLQTIFILKVWLSGLYWCKNIPIYLQLPVKILIFSPFSLNPQLQKPWVFPFRKQHHSSSLPPINRKASASTIHTPHSSTAMACPLSPWYAILGAHSVQTAGEQAFPRDKLPTKLDTELGPRPLLPIQG